MVEENENVTWTQHSCPSSACLWTQCDLLPPCSPYCKGLGSRTMNQNKPILPENIFTLTSFEGGEAVRKSSYAEISEQSEQLVLPFHCGIRGLNSAHQPWWKAFLLGDVSPLPLHLAFIFLFCCCFVQGLSQGHICYGQRTNHGSWSSSFTTWVPGIELRPSGWAASSAF